MFIPSWLVLVLGFVLGLTIALGISMIAPTITGARVVSHAFDFPGWQPVAEERKVRVYRQPFARLSQPVEPWVRGAQV